MDEQPNREIMIERRQVLNLSQEQVTEIAEAAAKIAVKEMQASLYQQIGKTFLSKASQLIGIILVALAVYLNSKGAFKLD